MKSAFTFYMLLLIVSILNFSETHAQCTDWLKLITTQYENGIDVGDIDIAGDQLTVEATFNRNANLPTDGPLYDGNLVSKHYDPDNVNYLLRPNNAEITTTDGYSTSYFTTPPICRITPNKTYHVAMVYNGISLKFYRNGFLMSEIAATGNLVLNNYHTKIGTKASEVQYFEQFRGYINEVRIWNVARSQVDIQSYMNSQLPNPTSQFGLIAYYTFNSLTNKQGNAAYDGTPTPVGYPQYAAALINQANPTCSDFSADYCNVPAISCNEFLRVPTSTSAMIIGDLDIIGDQLTVECVFNAQAQNTAYFGGDLVSKHGSPVNSNYLLRPLRGEITNTNGRFFKTDECTSLMQLNKTGHVAMVYNGQTLSFYSEGNLVSSVPASGNLFQNNFNTAIGFLANTSISNRESFNGYINEVRIWNIARTQDEIIAYMNQPLPNPSTKPGLKAYYTFNSTANKQGATQWNGTLVGSASINQGNADYCNNANLYGGCPQARIASLNSNDPKGGVTISFSGLQSATPNFSLSPNPTKDYVVINLSQSSNDTRLQIIDVLGRVSKSIQLKAGITQAKLDLHGFSKGIYRVVLTDKKVTESISLLVD